MGAVLLAAGAEEKRFALPHARILLHQPMGGFQGQATDIDIHAKEILRMREELDTILVKHTKQPIGKIHEDTERDFFMSGEQAAEYGIIDKVIMKRELAAIKSRFSTNKGMLELSAGAKNCETENITKLKTKTTARS